MYPLLLISLSYAPDQDRSFDTRFFFGLISLQGIRGILSKSNIPIGESGWRSGHQSRLPPLQPGIDSQAPHLD